MFALCLPQGVGDPSIAVHCSRLGWAVFFHSRETQSVRDFRLCGDRSQAATQGWQEGVRLPDRAAQTTFPRL